VELSYVLSFRSGFALSPQSDHFMKILNFGNCFALAKHLTQSYFALAKHLTQSYFALAKHLTQSYFALAKHLTQSYFALAKHSTQSSMAALCLLNLFAVNATFAQALPVTPNNAAPISTAPIKPAYAVVQQALSNEANPDVVFSKLLELREKGDLQGQIAALQRMLELRPYEADLQYELARIYSLAGERTGAFDTLIKLQQQGFAYEIEKEKAFDSLNKSEVYKYIKEGLDVNRKPFGNGKTLLAISNS
jgi:tetratricopeptide (TPR) repeat protein